MPQYPLIIAVDYDDTIVQHGVSGGFPAIGELKPHAAEVLSAWKAAGVRLILWTCRTDQPGKHPYLSDALQYLRQNGVEFDAVNQDHPSVTFRGAPYEGKIFADLYIDDRALGYDHAWSWLDKDKMVRSRYPEHFQPMTEYAA